MLRAPQTAWMNSCLPIIGGASEPWAAPRQLRDGGRLRAGRSVPPFARGKTAQTRALAAEAGRRRAIGRRRRSAVRSKSAGVSGAFSATS
jgi:hypothetical protein